MIFFFFFKFIKIIIWLLYSIGEKKNMSFKQHDIYIYIYIFIKFLIIILQIISRSYLNELNDQPDQIAQVSHMSFLHIHPFQATSSFQSSIPGLNKFVSPPDVIFRHLLQAVIHVCHMVWMYSHIAQCEALMQEGFNISDLV